MGVQEAGGMIRWIRRHPVLTIIGLLLVPLTVKGTLNLTGFCWKEKRYVPMEEKCEAAMRYTYDLYKKGVLDYLKIEGAYSRKIKHLIHYENYEDFVRRNSNACRAADSYMGWRVGFMDCLLGYCGGYARVEFAADADGVDPIALFLREKKGIFMIGESENISKKVRNIFSKLERQYNKDYIIIMDSGLDLREKQEKINVLMRHMVRDFKKIINSINDEREKAKVMEIYEKSKEEINIHSAIDVVFDNCGHVWDPLDD